MAAFPRVEEAAPAVGVVAVATPRVTYVFTIRATVRTRGPGELINPTIIIMIYLMQVFRVGDFGMPRISGNALLVHYLTRKLIGYFE